MTNKIIIKKTPNADSRTANNKLNEETLRKSTEIHRSDVNRIMKYMAEVIHETGEKHDYTKIKHWEEFRDNVLKPHTNEEFINAHWYQNHVSEERHHLNANCPIDVNLFDVLEMIADCVVAGKGRAGKITPAYLKLKDPLILERAYWNTIRLLDDIVSVSEDDGEGL